MRCKYQDQNSTITLREGIDEYYKANPHLLFPPGGEEGAADFFRCHDRIHVVFGCDTSFLHEVRTDFWTFFGSDLGILRYLSFIKSPAVRLLMADLKARIVKDPAIGDTMKAEVKRSVGPALLTPFRIFARARRMLKKWPWLESEGLLDRPLREIRSEYGICVLE